MVFKLLKEIYAMEAKAPFKEGEALIKDFGGTGTDVVFTRGSEG
jgi:CxxC motif-containing protein